MIARLAIAIATTVALLSAAPAAAQTWPSKPVRLVVPAPPGAPPDALARLFARTLGETLGQQVIAENRPGAGWTIGSAEVAKAAPDGHTLLWAVTSVVAIGPSLFPNAGYDLRTDFAPISAVNRTRMFLVVHPSIPATTMREFVEYAKARPGKLNYGSAGNGTLPHLAMELFKSATGVDIVHVPFKGNHFANLVAGDVQAAFESPVAFAPFVRADKARALAVASGTRDREFPAVPTAAEGGTAIDADGWFGIFAPRGTPAAVVARLNAETRKVVETKEYRDAIAKFGVESVATTPEQFATLVAAEHEKWTRAWKASGAKMD
jgi:tripartite-type tricarboxylate transporter receptor subunit TctC